jgi:putative ABC transport system permease protein
VDWDDRIRRQFDGRQVPDDEVINELAHHAEAAYQHARAEGCSPEEAERRLQDQLSAWSRDASVLRRRARRAPAPPPPPAHAGRGLGLLQDARYAWRMMMRDRSHALLVIATMALGIAAATVLFGVTYGVLLKPLPWPEAERLVRLYETRQGSTRPAAFFTNATYLAWRESATTIDGLAAWSGSQRVVEAGGNRERMAIADVTPSLFDVLRVRPQFGSPFGAAPDGAPTDEKEVLLSHGLWQQRFAGSTAAVGQMLRIEGESYRVMGVMPPSFVFPEPDVRAWIPLRVQPVLGKEPGLRSLSMFGGIARLRQGATLEQAVAEATARGRTAPDPGMVAIAVFGSNGPVEITAVPLLDSIAGDVRPALMVFLVAVGLLLATATANVASLQLARALTRRREVALRSAIGAGAGRLVRQFVIESLLPGALGGVAGVLLAAWLTRVLPALLPADFPRVADIGVDWRVAGVALLIALAASVVFGLVPALQARRVDLVSALNEDSLAPVGASGRTPVARARAMIMAGQIAVACVLLVGAALLARSFVAMLQADRGYDSSSLLTARLVLPDSAFTPTARTEVLRGVLERLRHVPGVMHAAFTTSLPLAGGDMLSSFPMRSARTGQEVQIQTSMRHVSPGYFSALRVRLHAGRTFTDADSEDTEPVAIVNRTFARQYLDDSPLDERIPINRHGEVTSARVVGVIEDVRHGSAVDPPRPELYRAYRQLSDGVLHHDPMLLVRTSREPLALVPELRAIVRTTAAAGLIDNVRTMEERVMTSLSRPRLYAVLLGTFAAFALAIAGVGLFGVLAYTVAQRSREIGVRSALGATPRAIVALVVRQAVWVTAAGVLIGVAVAFAGVQALARFLYGVEPRDPLTFGAAAGLLLLVAAAASLVPARRAATVDPLKVLR